MQRFQRLMVGLTGSERDGGLVRYAAMAARLGKSASVTFVHVWGAKEGEAGVGSDEPFPTDVQRRVEENFHDAPQSMQRSFKALRGPQVDALLTHAADQRIDLILIGHRPGHRPGRKALIRRLTMKAPCSVWIVPDGAQAEITRVLAPVDFSRPSADALEVATDITTRAEARECIALHVYRTQAVITYEESAPLVRGKEREEYEKFVKPIDLHGAEVRLALVESEDVAEAIHEVAQEQGVDLKVMSTRGRSRSAAILLGNVAEAVIVEAKTPLLIVKHFGSKLNLLETLLDRAFSREGPRFN